MSACKGISGWLFGHDYRARYSRSAPSVSLTRAHVVFADDIVKVLNSSKASTYHGEVCVRCGSTTNAPATAEGQE